MFISIDLYVYNLVFDVHFAYGVSCYRRVYISIWEIHDKLLFDTIKFPTKTLNKYFYTIFVYYPSILRFPSFHTTMDCATGAITTTSFLASITPPTKTSSPSVSFEIIVENPKKI